MNVVFEVSLCGEAYKESLNMSNGSRERLTGGQDLGHPNRFPLHQGIVDECEPSFRALLEALGHSGGELSRPG